MPNDDTCCSDSTTPLAFSYKLSSISLEGSVYLATYTFNLVNRRSQPIFNVLITDSLSSTNNVISTATGTVSYNPTQFTAVNDVLSFPVIPVVPPGTFSFTFNLTANLAQ